MTTKPQKRVAIVQSNYIPWKGYFDLIDQVDEFILLDEVQYTKSDWRNRNRVKAPNGLQWLTIPVRTRGRSGQVISAVETSGDAWRVAHWRTLQHCYAKAPFFRTYADQLSSLYLEDGERQLARINHTFISTICQWMGIQTHLSHARDYELVAGPTARLVALCRQADATEYLSGPAARDYIDPVQFREAGIQLTYFDYQGYPAYPQLYPPFEHAVTVLDLLLHVGPDAKQYLRRDAA